MNKPAIICTCLGFIAGACVVRIIDDNKLRRLEEFESQVKKQLDKNSDVDYVDISYTSADGENDVRDYDFKSEDFLGENANQSWSEIDRERVSEFLQDKEYMGSDYTEFAEDSTMEADSINLNVVNDLDVSLKSNKVIQLKKERPYNECCENNDGDDGSNDKNNEDTKMESDSESHTNNEDNPIKVISAVDFVKGVTSDTSRIRSLIFDVMTGKLYWNFTDEPLSNDEVELYVGFDLLLDIVNESLSNNKKWVEPKYLYDSRDNTYTKIEAGGVIW